MTSYELMRDYWKDDRTARHNLPRLQSAPNCPQKAGLTRVFAVAFFQTNRKLS